jgi:hypothetical protein
VPWSRRGSLRQASRRRGPEIAGPAGGVRAEDNLTAPIVVEGGDHHLGRQVDAGRQRIERDIADPRRAAFAVEQVAQPVELCARGIARADPLEVAQDAGGRARPRRPTGEDRLGRRLVLEELADLGQRQILDGTAEHQAAAARADREIEIAQHVMAGEQRAAAAIEVEQRHGLEH